jgi:hypothetical protein
MRVARRGAPGIPWWLWLGLVALVPLVLLNVSVAFFGGTVVNPLSLSFLESKASALGAYAKHRPRCLLYGHPPLDPLIDAAERRHRLPRGLLHALVEVESEKRVHRISPAGAMGPGQLMPGTARLLGVEDPFEPHEALDASARDLAEQLRRFRRLPLAVAAYNAGPGNVNGRVPRNGETEFYVVKVLGAYGRHRPPPERLVAAAPPRPAATVRRPAPSVKRTSAAQKKPAAAKPPRRAAKTARAGAKKPVPAG